MSWHKKYGLHRKMRKSKERYSASDKTIFVEAGQEPSENAVRLRDEHGYSIQIEVPFNPVLPKDFYTMKKPTAHEVLSDHPQGKTQLEQIKDHLLKHKKITTIEAFKKYSITRLSQYIMMLRNENFIIDTIWKKNETTNTRYGEYVLNT